MTKQAAVDFLKEIAARVGGGLHPDTPIDEYENEDGERSFTDAEIARMEPMLDEAFAVLGDSIYDEALKIQQEVMAK